MTDWIEAMRGGDDDDLTDELFECDRCGEVYHYDLLGYNESPEPYSDDGLGWLACINCFRPIAEAWLRQDEEMDRRYAEQAERISRVPIVDGHVN